MLFRNKGGACSGGKTSTAATFAGPSLIFGGVSTNIINIALDCACLQERLGGRATRLREAQPAILTACGDARPASSIDPLNDIFLHRPKRPHFRHSIPS